MNTWVLHFILLFFVPTFSCFGQFPYQLNPTTDYSLIGLGALSLTAGQIVSNNKEPLTATEISRLNPQSINSFDRGAINNYSSSSNTLSEAILLGTGLSSLTLLVDKSIRSEWVTIGVMGIETMMLTYGFAGVTKPVMLRTRPYVYNSTVPLERKQELDARYSFYSRTTAATAAISFFAAKVYVDTHPNSKWKPVVWGGAIVLPIITSWAKVDAGEHFKTDVIAGYAIGSLIGYFIPVLHYQRQGGNTKVSIEPNFEGVSLKLHF